MRAAIPLPHAFSSLTIILHTGTFGKILGVKTTEQSHLESVETALFADAEIYRINAGIPH